MPCAYLQNPHRSNTYLAFSPDSRRLAAAGNAAGVTVWDLADPAAAAKVSLCSSRAFEAIRFRPVGTSLLAFSNHGGLRALDVADGSERDINVTGGQGIFRTSLAPTGDRIAGILVHTAGGIRHSFVIVSFAPETRDGWIEGTPEHR